jgi:hypothetical protein
MPGTSIVIASPLEDVWSFLTTADNWQAFHGAALTHVVPGWQRGATLTWSNGSTSNLEECIDRKTLRLCSTFMSSTFELEPQGDDTELRYYFEARGGASFSDGGSAHLAAYRENLLRLKGLLEDER